jgi:hypothetical protein
MGPRMGWGVGLMVAAGALANVRAVTVPVVPVGVLVGGVTVTRSTRTIRYYAAESLARAVVAGNLFRSDRRPGAVPYDPTRGAAPLPDGPAKPTLTLTGVVWGDEPQAVVEGLPTTDGPRVVRAGDVIGGLTIRRIEGARVMIVGMDTVWTLVVREPWK